MLLRFGIQNFRSIRDIQELSLVASALNDPDAGLLDCPPAGDRILPAVIIYGANASGKSNLVRAVRWMRQGVLLSHSQGVADGGVPREAFALDPSSRDAPTVCNMDFVIENVRYHYGFEANDEIFSREWLYSFPNGRRQMLFERDGEEFEFGRNLRGRNRVIADLTRPNSLFVAAATQNGHEELSKISGFFRTISNDELPSRWSISDSRATDFLGLIGTGIVGARVSKVDVSEKAKEFASEFASLIKRTFGEGREMQFDDRHPEKLELAHKGKDGAEVYFDLDDESAGTRRLVGFLVAAYLALDRGSVMIVDELDESLHTAACEALLALFMSPTANPRGAQLVATTHDTNLLRCPSLRRDQVWFTEKDGEGATHLYPLTDFRTRRGDNLERGYLQGRYGATPFSGSLADIIALN